MRHAFSFMTFGRLVRLRSARGGLAKILHRAGRSRSLRCAAAHDSELI